MQCVISTPLLLRNCLPTLSRRAEFKDDPKHLGQATGMASFGQVRFSPRSPPRNRSRIHCKQFLGGTIGLAVAQAVFSSQLTKNLATFAPTAPLQIVRESPTSIFSLAPDLVAAVVHAYV